MTIAVLGSADQAINGFAEFADACREIGALLASTRCEVVVCSQNTSTADLYVVEGINTVKERKSMVHVIRSEQDEKEAPYFSNQSKYPNISFTFSRIVGDWRATHLKAITRSDVLIVIGGKESVRSAADSSFILEKPVIAIPSFGGTSKDVWDRHNGEYTRNGVANEQLGIIREKWTSKTVHALKSILNCLYRKRPGRASIGRALPYALVLLCVFGLAWTWVSLFDAGSKNPSLLTLVLISLLSASTGILLRGSLIDRYYENIINGIGSIFLDFVKGTVIGFVLVPLYLLSELTVNGSLNSSYTVTSFTRIGLMLTVVAFCSSFLLDSSIERFSAIAKEKIRDLGK